MRNSAIEKVLDNAINNVPFLSFDELSKEPYIKMSEHDFITRQVEPQKVGYTKKLVTVFSICMILLVSMSWWYSANAKAQSVITLDINPSIQLMLNQKNHIIDVIALNEDAKTVISGNKFKGKPLDETVEQLMDSLVEKNYLNQEKKTILVSIVNRNNEKADVLLGETTQVIMNTLSSKDINPVILEQRINKKDSNTKLAKQYHISIGKLKLIQKIIAVNDKYTLDTLAPMTVQELIMLMKANSIEKRDDLSIINDGNDSNNQDNQDSSGEKENSSDKIDKKPNQLTTTPDKAKGSNGKGNGYNNGIKEKNDKGKGVKDKNETTDKNPGKGNQGMNQNGNNKNYTDNGQGKSVNQENDKQKNENQNTKDKVDKKDKNQKNFAKGNGNKVKSQVVSQGQPHSSDKQDDKNEQKNNK